MDFVSCKKPLLSIGLILLSAPFMTNYAVANERFDRSSRVVVSVKTGTPSILPPLFQQIAPLADPFAAPFLASRPQVVQQSVNIQQPSVIRQSVTYEVPTMVGIRPAPIGEPVIYVIETGKRSGSHRQTVRP
jgi:hypothetical protein